MEPNVNGMHITWDVYHVYIQDVCVGNIQIQIITASPLSEYS